MAANSSGYPTHVELYLFVNDRRLELGQVGSERFTLRYPEDIPLSRAEIVTIVDGEETRNPVFLPTGASAANRRIPYQSLTSVSSATTPLAFEIRPAIGSFPQSSSRFSMTLPFCAPHSEFRTRLTPSSAPSAADSDKPTPAAA